MDNQTKLYISTSQQETASFPDANTLLAREVYERLQQQIQEAKEEAHKAQEANDLDHPRAHNAILIDGGRGTGKSSVLVNLPVYLKQKAPELLQEIHIVKPVDPTLLEDHDDLFLHVIVAAVLSDREVQKAQRNEPKYRDMLRALEELAHGLESVEAQKEERGLDKLRSFIGNRQLNSKVHDFFKSVLQLLGKKLLVLTIDDVDTALDRAYENLEIVRRYLNTPLVLPIISGDLALYNEVVWREFHGKLVKPANIDQEQAKQWAITLAEEYQRKILPVQNRMPMPEISDYLTSFDIEVKNRDNKAITTLGAFYAWLEIFIAGPVNNYENSRLPLPIPSVRALAQLIRRCDGDKELEGLLAGISGAKDAWAAKRAFQFDSSVSNDAIVGFGGRYEKLRLDVSRKFSPAYQYFADEIKKVVGGGENISRASAASFSKKLLGHFSSESKAGAVCLVLETMQYWYGEGKISGGVFDTGLFQPLNHSREGYEYFEKDYSLAVWRKNFEGRLPAEWLEEVGGSRAILAYPLPDNGPWGALKWDGGFKGEPMEAFLIRLLTNKNYYSESSRGLMIQVGRLFELLVTSFVRDVDVGFLIDLLVRPPFYSTSVLAPTKTQLAKDGEEIEDEDAEPDLDTVDIELLKDVVKEINEWRQGCGLDNAIFSPWLIYNIFNKLFNQAQIFNRSASVSDEGDFFKGALQIGLHAFYSFWSACGSFEKGPLFGFPLVISTVNLVRPNNFEKNPLFRQNVLPFYPEGEAVDNNVVVFGEKSRALTYFLGWHPLRKWFEEAVYKFGVKIKPTGLLFKGDKKSYLANGKGGADDQRRAAFIRLKELLSIKGNVLWLQEKHVANALPKVSSVELVVSTMKAEYPRSDALDLLLKVVGDLGGKSNS